MVYGFLYQKKSFNDVSSLLYVFQDFNLERLDDTTFKFTDQEDTFLFSSDRSSLECASKIFKLEHNFTEELLSQSNVILTSAGEPIVTSFTDKLLQTFLEKNLILTGGNIEFEHPNFVQENAFHFYHLYNFLGFRFLNYNQSFNKTNLVGVYYKDTHISGRPLKNRTKLFNNVKDILQDNLVAYSMPETKLSELLVEFNQGFGLWEKIHTPSYTDYMTSVCSIIFETNSVTDDNPAPREHITEKTLKALLFSQAKIFSLLFCSPKQYKYLVDNGFWLLNFEFIDDSKDITEQTIMDSIVKACEFVNSLYNDSGSLEEAYFQLLAIYEHKLEKNSELITNLLNTCPADAKKRVLDFIRKDNESEKQQGPNHRWSRLSWLNPRRISVN